MKKDVNYTVYEIANFENADDWRLGLKTCCFCDNDCKNEYPKEFILDFLKNIQDNKRCKFVIVNNSTKEATLLNEFNY